MTFRTPSWARLALALVLGASATLAAAQTSFSTTYRGGSSSTCGSSYSIAGKEPSGAGRYPVFVHLAGTGEPFNSAWAQAAVDSAVARGFVAATVEYASGTFGTCSTITARTRCIFNSANRNSAISRLCARSKADCSKGVVTLGLSQGGVVAVLARNFESRVQASLGQGVGSTYSVYNLASCIDNGRHVQPGNRLRIVNGEADLFVGGTVGTARASGERVTGMRCGSTATQCFDGAGAGWYVVRNTQVQDLQADHCFMGVLGTPGIQCTGIAAVDSGYRYGSEPWAINPGVDWLKTYVAP